MVGRLPVSGFQHRGPQGEQADDAAVFLEELEGFIALVAHVGGNGSRAGVGDHHGLFAVADDVQGGLVSGQPSATMPNRFMAFTYRRNP